MVCLMKELKINDMKSRQKAEVAKLTCMGFVVWSYWKSMLSFVISLVKKCLPIICLYSSEVLNILKIIKTKSY